MSNPTENPEAFVFFAPVEGHVVSRFGSGTATSNAQPIGYLRDRETGCFKMIDEAIVVPIPVAEYERFAREYDRAVKDEALRRVDAAAFGAWQAKLAERAKEAAKEEAAKAKASAEKAAPRPGAEPPPAG